MAIAQDLSPGSFIKKEGTKVNSIALETLNNIDGYFGSCLVESQSGKVLKVNGGNPENLAVVGKGNSAVLRAERDMMEFLEIDGELEDILITLGGQYHILRPLTKNGDFFINVILDRIKANLAMARLEIKSFEESIILD